MDAAAIVKALDMVSVALIVAAIRRLGGSCTRKPVRDFERNTAHGSLVV